MFKSDEIRSTTIGTAGADPAILTPPSKENTVPAVASTAPDSTKDAGRVHVGGGMMRF